MTEPWPRLAAIARRYQRRPSHPCAQEGCPTLLDDERGHVLCDFHVVSRRLAQGLDRWGSPQADKSVEKRLAGSRQWR